jgi:uncharacterized protein YjbI with pentapeptide repeats
MILPQRAPVRPRIVSPVSGETLPLEEEVRQLLAAGSGGLVALVGPAGTGKTTALRHLAAVLPSGADVLLLDERDVATEPCTERQLVIRATQAVSGDTPRVVYRMAPWSADDLIEYLLATGKDRCASVMARLRPRDRTVCGGLPDLWRPVLDVLALNDAVPDARTALWRHVVGYLHDPDLLWRTRSGCLGALMAPKGKEAQALEGLIAPDLPEGLGRALRHRGVQVLLAGDQIVDNLRSGADCEPLTQRLPQDLVQAVGTAVAGEDRSLTCLRRLAVGPPSQQAMAASILHAAGTGWTPESGRVAVLRGAYLAGVHWPRVALAGADLEETDLTAADLREADLQKARADKTVLRQACLAGASLEGMRAMTADLANADLSRVRAGSAFFAGANLAGANLEGAALRQANFFGANLSEAVFRGADLAQADFLQAELERADFSGADLARAQLSRLRLREASWDGASFAGAHLVDCDLEGLVLPAACFASADLAGALLTGCVMPGANFERANLQGAGLGDVDWEGASLRGADLRGATFHMGSTRSGMVGSPLACEGSRTGFYTDDYEEQSYKAPEEIRKANLCRADLREANLDGVDFYLVDLRGARYDCKYEEHFRRCGAILKARVED